MVNWEVKMDDLYYLFYFTFGEIKGRKSIKRDFDICQTNILTNWKEWRKVRLLLWENEKNKIEVTELFTLFCL